MKAKYYLFLKQKGSTISTSEYLIAGRRQEIELFRRLLEDRRNSYGLWFYGPGGIGKSALIRQCCQIAKPIGYRIIGDKDKIVKETPARYFIRVCGFEKERYQVLELTDITSEILAKLTGELRENTIIVIDASKDFEDYNRLIEFVESFIERLKCLDDRVFLLIATRRPPRYTPSHIALTRLSGLTKDEIEEFIELKGGDEDLKKYAEILKEKTGGWPLVLEAICSSP